MKECERKTIQIFSKAMTTSQHSGGKMKLSEFHVLTIFVFYITIIESKDLPKLPNRGSLYGLDIQPIVFDENEFERDAVQLNISWKSADLGGRKIDVHLYPVANEHCSHTTPCPVYDLPANTTHILIPDDPMLDIIPSHATSSRCYVRLGCEYDVMVHSTGRAAQSLRLRTRYTVPDCVGTICVCRNAQYLPAVSMNATEDGNNLKVFWKIDKSTYDWSSENVSLREIFIRVFIKPDAHVPWGGGGGSKMELEIPLSSVDDSMVSTKENGIHLVDLTDAIANLTSFKVSMKSHVVDSRRCAGNETSFTYKVDSNKTTTVYASNHSVKTLFVCFFIVVLLLVSGFVFTYFRMRHILLTKSFVKYWRVLYQNEPNVGFKPMKFQENFLYGEDYFEHCEIPHSSLKLSHNIGKGAFGSVYLAVANQIGAKQCSGLVAVKKLKKDHNVDEMDEFLSEISIMKSISRHPNIVSLIGYCTVKQPMLMVMEYVGCGDLLNYLRRLREQHEIRATVAAARRSENPIRQSTGSKTTENSASSTMQLLSHNNTNGDSTKSPKHYGNNINASDNRMANTDMPITVTTLKKLEQQMNYLELCYSSESVISTCSTKDVSVASTKRISDADNYVGYHTNPQAMSSLECILDHRELHNFAVQIARGMKHLEDRGIMHRDLAARNILIDEQKQLKISDFGLSRSIIYVTQGRKKMPIRWMAIEALRQNVYTSKSDVWSFAVVLWEIGTLGGIPYAHVSNELLLKYLIDGNRLQWPEICSEELYKLMQRCWSENPDLRPFFAEIVQLLEQKENSSHLYVNFDSIASNYVFPPTMPVESEHPNQIEV